MESHITLENRMEELGRMPAWLEELGEAWGLPAASMLSFNVALEEAVSNIILYGYDDPGTHQIELQATLQDGVLRFVLRDDGHEFDPTRRPPPDLNLPAEERPIGGLGIYMIHKIMDRVEYHRINSYNHLILTKNTGT
jgi:anti-sigma regulatory factor (Ser/Thr protein kinase)